MKNKTKNSEYQDISIFGITRLNSKPEGWWVRLHWVVGIPQVQKLFTDSKFKNNPMSSLYAALKFRDKKLNELESQGIHVQTTQKRPFRTKHNKTGIAGVSLTSVPRRSGNGHYLIYQATYRRNQSPINKKFGLTAYGGQFKAFVAACQFRHEGELAEYGYSITPTDVRELWAVFEKYNY